MCRKIYEQNLSNEFIKDSFVDKEVFFTNLIIAQILRCSPVLLKYIGNH